MKSQFVGVVEIVQPVQIRAVEKQLAAFQPLDETVECLVLDFVTPVVPDCVGA